MVVVDDLIDEGEEFPSDPADGVVFAVVGTLHVLMRLPMSYCSGRRGGRIHRQRGIVQQFCAIHLPLPNIFTNWHRMFEIAGAASSIGTHDGRNPCDPDANCCAILCVPHCTLVHA